MSSTPLRPPSLPPDEQLRRCLELVAKPDEGLLVAVSGGSDSVALLAAAVRVWPRLHAAHVHHGLRDAADRDAEAVARLCADLGVPLEILAAPPVHPKERSETSARRRRLAALCELATRRGLPWILTAHHLDDALETALLNLRRGHRGARALAGIPTLRPARFTSGTQGPRYLRPFLFGPAPLGRQELTVWREGAGLPFVQDESNADLSIPRNELRAVLARDRAPLSRERLCSLRRAARVILQTQLGQAAEGLTRYLRKEGLGARLDGQLFGAAPPPGEVVECLRLLGPCLRPLHQLTLRASVLERLVEGLALGRGRLLLPAVPAPLVVECRRDGLHFPEVTVASGDPAARVLTALGSTPLFL